MVVVVKQTRVPARVLPCCALSSRMLRAYVCQLSNHGRYVMIDARAQPRFRVACCTDLARCNLPDVSISLAKVWPLKLFLLAE
jgi:hypothetical protein